MNMKHPPGTDITPRQSSDGEHNHWEDEGQHDEGTDSEQQPSRKGVGHHLGAAGGYNNI